ncbi:MAG: quercetin dioxygenase-like cupin family protein [Crocinitomicaceae bacterium]|jgi:quercetin dioxygenase-like cupin family protein
MNLEELHNADKSVSAVPVFKTKNGTTVSIKIKAGEQLKEHITKVPALLVCLNGKAVFENEQGLKEHLSGGDYLELEPMVKHWINAIDESNFLLIKS